MSPQLDLFGTPAPTGPYAPAQHRAEEEQPAPVATVAHVVEEHGWRIAYTTPAPEIVEEAALEVPPPSGPEPLAPPTAPEWELYGRDLFGNAIRPPERGKIAGAFVFPPFSVLNAREGAWQDRKRAWVAAGIRAGEGRSEVLLAGHQNSTEQAADLARRYGIDEEKLATGGGVYTEASSIFDPVLCELAYRWFCPEGGHVLDPFAGESTKGIVAALLGYGYTGCELRPEQVEANRAQAAAIGVAPTWLCGDSGRIGDLLPPGAKYDFVWTSPPYYDLEVYSKSERDGSAFESYATFMEWYEVIFAQCIARLRDNRFLGVKVGEIRDERGVYRNFVGDNTAVFRRLGLHYYNEVILVTSAGSLPLRVGKHFRVGRKVGKCHQNVLLYWKGDPRALNATVREWPIEVGA